MPQKPIHRDDPRAFEIKTESGTIYEVSAPDEKGYREIKRRAKGESHTQAFAKAAGDKLGNVGKVIPTERTAMRGRFRNPVSVGLSLYIEIENENRVLVSENVEEVNPRD